MLTAVPNSKRMELEVTNLPFGVSVNNLDLRSTSNEVCEKLRDLVYEHKLLVISGQNLTASAYVEFARKIGTPQVYLQKNYHHPEFPEIFVSANGPVSGKKMGVARTGYFWHSDCSFEEKPLAFTMIYPQILPDSERSTYFVNMEEVLEFLPVELRERIGTSISLHDGHSRYKITAEDVGRPLHEVLDFLAVKCPYAIHPMVIKHPFTGQEILYINQGFTSRILGMSVYESWALLSRVFAHIEQPRFIQSYEWKEGDIAIWDNRSLIHKSGAIPQNQTSAMFRIGLYDDRGLFEHAVANYQVKMKEIYPCF